MANEEHVALLRQGVNVWNAWREKEPSIRPDLGEADLTWANLNGADLSKADLSKADLFEAVLFKANLSGADLSEANLHGADLRRANLNRAVLIRTNLSGANLTKATLRSATLRGADLAGADLTGADLVRAELLEANLTKAKLTGANLNFANLAEVDFTGADLSGCRVHGISAWNQKLDGAKQQNLIITDFGEPEITVDDIEVAQFVYFLLHNKRIGKAIDTIGKKGVLLLGRFTGGRLAILERLRDELRKRDLLPMVFNFDEPEIKSFTETVRILAGLSHFVIVDLSDPRSVPHELQALVPNNAIPFVPIIKQGQDPYAMFRDLLIHDWVLKPVIVYSSVDGLIGALDKDIIMPAREKFNELLARRTEQARVPVKLV